MVVRRRKKSRKYRGTRYMRRGYNDRNRNAGNKGGHGFAGWKKKAHKLTKLLKEFPEKFEDKKGFTCPTKKKKYIILNLKDLESLLPKFEKMGIASKAEDLIVIDLTKLGYIKLLGEGEVHNKYKILVNAASRSAAEKVQKVGGIVEVKPF